MTTWALALDYRTDLSGPRVVGSDFWTDPRQCEWRLVAPTFSAFADALGRELPSTGQRPVLDVDEEDADDRTDVL